MSLDAPQSTTQNSISIMCSLLTCIYLSDVLFAIAVLNSAESPLFSQIQPANKHPEANFLAPNDDQKLEQRWHHQSNHCLRYQSGQVSQLCWKQRR